MALTPKKPFALTKPVQLLVNGLAPSGLQDSYGRYIDGDHNGTAGSNAIAILSKKGVTVDAVELVRTRSAHGDDRPPSSMPCSRGASWRA